MTEEFLHHVWKFKLFNSQSIQTTDGEVLEIIKSGTHNTDSGPDFFNTQIKVGDTLWAGNAEVHINASDWKKHFHQLDDAYNNIVLHIVYNADTQVLRKSGEAIPTLELKGMIDEKLFHTYLNFKSSTNWIPCEKQLKVVPQIIINTTIDKLLTERLERKATTIVRNFKLNNNNWEEVFYQHLARNFGFKTNAESFELLAKSLPLIVLSKHKNSLLQIEAMLFGQAGMLNEHYDDKYAQALQNEYVFLKQKFKLQPIEKHLWKFLRLRPVNFPTIRIAQFANLIHNSSHLFSKIIETENLNKLKLLMNTGVSEYWKTHYLFDKQTIEKSKHLGEDAIDTIIINTVIPFLFVYGKYKNENVYVDRALNFLECMDAENNSIIKKWISLGVPVRTAYSSQALLQLKNEYCMHKKCLQCSIGNYVLKNA